MTNCFNCDKELTGLKTKWCGPVCHKVGDAKERRRRNTFGPIVVKEKEKRGVIEWAYGTWSNRTMSTERFIKTIMELK